MRFTFHLLSAELLSVELSRGPVADVAEEPELDCGAAGGQFELGFRAPTTLTPTDETSD